MEDHGHCPNKTSQAADRIEIVQDLTFYGSVVKCLTQAPIFEHLFPAAGTVLGLCSSIRLVASL